MEGGVLLWADRSKQEVAEKVWIGRGSRATWFYTFIDLLRKVTHTTRNYLTAGVRE